MKTRFGLAAAFATTGMLIGGHAVGFFGGAEIGGGYVGPMQAATWFDPAEPCLDPDASVQSYTDPAFALTQHAINVSNIGNDGDDETYLKCEAIANLNEMRCLAGIGNGVHVACSDGSGPRILPVDGDIVYMTFDTTNASDCEIVVATGNRFGVANPACYPENGEGGGGTSTGTTTGTGTGSSTGTSTGSTTLGCDASNSTAVIGSTETSLSAGDCYSFHKQQGVLRVGNWTGSSFSIDVEDSAMNELSVSAAPGSWTQIAGAANGTVYFTVDANVNAQIDSW